ncbi:MAG: hypothetical protein EON60_02475 [Alphaproteobacteria bacterium]|nr:MAG: hypothetical protein EON60_02475 [Alphaproteobacteria bacterium]
MRTEHYYTSRGRQRAVFLCPDETVKFALSVMDGDSAHVEVSHDPEDFVRRGKGQWELFEGGLGGGLFGVTAMRVHVQRVDGWVKLIVERNKHERTGE